MHCIKYVLNVSDEEWGPIYTIEASQQHLFLSQKGSDATVKRLRFFLSFYFFWRSPRGTNIGDTSTMRRFLGLILLLLGSRESDCKARSCCVCGVCCFCAKNAIWAADRWATFSLAMCRLLKKKTILPACKDFLWLLLGEKTISFPLCHQVGVRLPAGRLSIRGLTSTDFWKVLPTFAAREFFYYPWYMEHAFSKGCHNFLAKGFNLKSSRYFGNFLCANRKFITAKTIKCNHFMFSNLSFITM